MVNGYCHLCNTLYSGTFHQCTGGAGFSQINSPTFNYPQVPQGWECPKCKQVFAPFVPKCTSCGNVGVTTVSSNSGVAINSDSGTFTVNK